VPSQCPLRFESDRSAALPRSDGKCQKATFAWQQIFLFDHLVGAGKQWKRYRKGRAAEKNSLLIVWFQLVQKGIRPVLHSRCSRLVLKTFTDHTLRTH
jgi:hypothetical protein